MNITITSRRLLLSEECLALTKRIVERVLARVRERVRDVLVVFSDENGQKRGSDDKTCGIKVTLSSGESIYVKRRHSRIEGAVTNSAHTLKRQMHRVIHL